MNQEYSPPSDEDYDLMSVGNSRVRYRLIDASSPDEDEDEQQDENDEMAWRRFRPSVLRKVCQSMYTGALISLLSPVILGLSIHHDRLRLVRNDTQLPISPEGDNPS